jgi:hypothetical protein
MFMPICKCGQVMCYSISDAQYQREKEFWNNWECRFCNPNWEGSLKRWKNDKIHKKRCANMESM